MEQTLEMRLGRIEQVDLDRLILLRAPIQISHKRTPTSDVQSFLGYYAGATDKNVYCCESIHGPQKPVSQLSWWQRLEYALESVPRDHVTAITVFKGDKHFFFEYPGE